MKQNAQKLANFINSLSDFEYRSITESYNYKIGDTISLSVDDSRQLTNNHMAATIIDGVLQAGLRYDTVVKPRVDKFKANYPELTTSSKFLAFIKNEDMYSVLNFRPNNVNDKIKRIEEVVSLFVKNKVETEDDLYDWLSKEQILLYRCKKVATNGCSHY